MTGPEQPRQATAETVYGEGILTDELCRLGDCVVVTSRTPWALHREYFPREPRAVVMPGTLERAELDTLGARMPSGTRVVGLGGGSVIDAAKYFAHLRGETPVLVPTVASSNGPFSEWISVRRDGRPAGFRVPGLPRRIVVDYAVIQRSDGRLNRSGFGDLLPLQTTLNDWRIAAAAGRGVPVDSAVEAAGTELMRQAMASAREVGSLSRHGIETLMRLLEATTGLMLAHPSLPISAGSEHLFAWSLESLTGRHFLHGEIVALGIVIASYLQRPDFDHHAPLRRALDEARVAYHPDQVGLTWDEIEQALLGIDAYNREVRHFHTVFDDVDWTPGLLAEVREVIFSPAATDTPEQRPA